MRLDKRKREAKATIRKWCQKNIDRKVESITHISPGCFVIGYAAPGALIVARPWMDSEPQCKAFDKNNPYTVAHEFDRSLKPGDWCLMAYLRAGSCGWLIAVAIV